MRVYLYRDAGALAALRTTEAKVREVLDRVARGTNTRGLVVVVRLRTGSNGWSGAYDPNWATPATLRRMRGPWRKAHAAGVPPRLPRRFRLIEITIGTDRMRYPREELNQNGFRLRFRTVRAHLAYIFAHELHHYRTYHLGLHKGEGERAADVWALGKVRALGFGMEMRPVRKKRRKEKRPRKKPSERYLRRIRRLGRWSLLRLAASDNRRLPVGEVVRFLRPLRNSHRVLVRDAEGAERAVPAEWLRIVEER